MPSTAANDSGTQRYWAFISYSSKDRRTGEWLHRRLERYPIPDQLRGTKIFDGAVLGKNLRPVFRDRDELSGSADLGPAILGALRKSRFLIVICSPNAARSAWVNKEILDFKALHPDNPKRILALILEGEPNATANPGMDDAVECFPPALRYPEEPLAGDLRSEGDGKERGFLKILSGIVQLDFDKLYRRHERYLHRRRMIASFIAGSLILVLSGLAAFAFVQRQEAQRQAGIAIRQRAETQQTMATGFLRSFGQSPGEKLSGAEESALMELAAVAERDVAVRKDFIRRLFDEPEFCRRLLARSAMVIHATAGFNPTLRTLLSSQAREILTDASALRIQREAAALTLAHLADEPLEISIVCAELAAWLADRESAPPLALAAEISEAFQSPLPADDARLLADLLTERIGISGDTADETEIARIFVALAPSFDAVRADAAMAALVGRMLHSISAPTLDPFGAAVKALAPRISPERRKYRTGGLAEILVTDPSANRVNSAGAALHAMAPSVPPAEAQVIADKLSSAIQSVVRTPLHGLLVVAAFSSLDGVDAELSRALAIRLTDVWAESPGKQETEAYQFAINRLLEKADTENRAHIVKHLIRRLSAGSFATGSHRTTMILLVAERAGQAALVPHLGELLDFQIASYDFSIMEILLKVLGKASETLDPGERAGAFSGLRNKADAITNPHVREILLAAISGNPAEPAGEPEALFKAELAQILNPKFGLPPNAPTGLRVIVVKDIPVGLRGWNRAVERSLGYDGRATQANPATLSFSPPDFGLLRGMAAKLEASAVEAARLDILGALSPENSLFSACRLGAAALALDPSPTREEADRIAESLLAIMAAGQHPHYILHTIPVFKELIPHIGDAMSDRVTAQLLDFTRQGYPPAAGADLRQALVAAGKRGDADTLIVRLLAIIHGESYPSIAAWIAPLAAGLSREELVNLLKNPFCIGEARLVCKDILLERLGHIPIDVKSEVGLAETLRLAAAAGCKIENPWRNIHR